MPPHVLIANRLHESCEAGLAERFAVKRLYAEEDKARFLAETGPMIRAVAGYAVPGDLIAALPNLEIVANFGVGYDRVDIAAARARNIPVTNTPSVLDDAMAEFTIGTMIALAHKLAVADRFVRRGDWPGGPFPLQTELRGKTVGILGLGRIGTEIALRAQAMKMRVVYHGRHRQPNVPFTYYSALQHMARDADWLVVVTPGGPQTEHLVDAAVLDALGPKGFVVNVARGSVVDEAALIERLADGRLRGAALDVFANEPEVPRALMDLDNVVLTPHIGSATTETRTAMGQLLIDNLVAHFAGAPLLTRVV